MINQSLSLNYKFRFPSAQRSFLMPFHSFLTMSFYVKCFILGDDPGNCFSVDVSNTDDISMLKRKIKQKRAVQLTQVDVTELELRMVNFRLDKLESELAELMLNKYPTLLSMWKVSSIFNKVNPLDDYLHIVVVAPVSLKLFSVVEEEEMTWNNVFLVDVDSRKTVSDLRVAVKEMLKPKFDYISADELTLFKVSIPLDDSATADTSFNVDVGLLNSLMPTEPLSRLFPQVIKNHLHIVIQVPYVGELTAPLISELTISLLSFRDSRYQRRGGQRPYQYFA